MHYLHRPAAEHVGGSHQHGITRALGDGDRVVDRRGGAAHRLRDPDRSKRIREGASVLRQVDRLHARAHHPDSAPFEGIREVDRRLPTKLHERPSHLLGFRNLGRAVLVERFEVEAV